MSEQPSTGGTGSADEGQHADLPADAASSGDLPAGGEPTPGSDNDGAEAGYTPPSGTEQS